MFEPLRDHHLGVYPSSASVSDIKKAIYVLYVIIWYKKFPDDYLSGVETFTQ